MSNPYGAYLTPQGEPQLSDSCVLFWDVLGVKAGSTSDEPMPFLLSLHKALEAARGVADTDATNESRAPTWFTDNVFVGTPINEMQFAEIALGGTILDAAKMTTELLRHGFLARGGISVGDHFMDDSFVFGPALVEAYEREDATKRPRIVVLQVGGFTRCGGTPRLWAAR